VSDKDSFKAVELGFKSLLDELVFVTVLQVNYRNLMLSSCKAETFKLRWKFDYLWEL
jgi:hypothetical protein